MGIERAVHGWWVLVVVVGGWLGRWGWLVVVEGEGVLRTLGGWGQLASVGWVGVWWLLWGECCWCSVGWLGVGCWVLVVGLVVSGGWCWLIRSIAGFSHAHASRTHNTPSATRNWGIFQCLIYSGCIPLQKSMCIVAVGPVEQSILIFAEVKC